MTSAKRRSRQAPGSDSHSSSDAVALLDVEQLAELLEIRDLAKRIEAVDRRVANALDEFRRSLRPHVFSFLTAPAKRIRAVLVIASAQVGESFDKRVVAAAASIELVQLGSLIHDDIIEEAPTRRGSTTLNESDGVPVALVVGDLVLAEAGLLATELHPEASSLLADAMAHMAAGQLDELRDLFDVERTLKRYRAAAQAKTGALFAAACRLGGLCAGLSGRRLDALTAFGGEFGLMYQLIDDILDVVGDPERLGKPVGVDMATGVYTAPVIGALKKRGGRTLARLLSRRRAEDLAEAMGRVQRSGAVEDAEKAVRSLAREASRALKPVAGTGVGRGLQRLPQLYAEWALRELRAAS